MDLFQKCKELYEKIRYFEYGIPVDGVIKPVPSPEYFAQNYHFLKPEEFEKYGGGICWDYVEYERKFLEVNDIDFNQYYIITNTPPNYDTHTFITVKDGDDLIYIESSFKRVEHIIDGVQKFKSLEDIVKLITTNMWYCNDNDKHFDEFKYDVCKFKGHPQYGCTCQEYMKWMDDNSDIVIQDVSINPKKINEDELAVEEFSVNKIDTKFTQFVCESVNDPEEYDETLHDHIADEDDVYNESWTDFKNGVHPSSNLMFHISLKNDMDGKTITPQLPSYITDDGELDDNYQEDTKTKRLCVSPSIEGCLIAILSYKKIREHVGDKFYVYTPEKPFSQYKHKTNKEIVKDKLVFDANITKEAWILEPCKLKLYGIIKLKKVKDLKKKPTVEKGIKMNTIKLDYEWIMTPKASGKFNKAIGDSPDEESDKKEKPIKEYDNILIPNEEFFMESQKRRDSYLKKIKYDPKTQTADTGILDTKTGKNIRIKIKFDPSDPNGSYYHHGRDFKTENGNDLNKFLDTAYINIRRGDLNQKKNAGMTVFYHEIGHFLFDLVRYFRDHLNPSDVERLMKWDAEVEKYNASLDEDMVNNLNSHDIKPEEMMADLNATSNVSRQSYNHHYKGYHNQNKNIKGLKKQEKILNSKIEQAKANKDSKRLFNLYNTKDIVDSQNQALRENAASTRNRLKANEELTKRLNESANVIVSNEEFFEEFVSSKQRNREKKFLKERNFVPDKDNPNKGWIDSDFKDKNGKPKRIRFEINNDSVIASTNSEDRIQMTRKALRTHPGISSADFKHEEGHMFAKQKYKEWAKSHPKPEDMSLEDHMNEFYKSGEFKDFFTRVSKDLEKAAEKGMTEHGKNLEEYFADAFALANSLNESMDIKSIRTMGRRINSNKEYNKLLNRFNANVDNITNYVAKNMIATVSNDIKWIKDCPEDIRNNEHFKKLRKAISDCQLYKNLIQIEERTKEFDRRLINIFNSSLNDFKSLHDQKSIEAKAKLKQNKEELMVKIKKQDEKIQSMKAELKIKKKFVEDCKKDIHNLYKASAAANSNLTNMQKEIIDDVKKSQKVLNNEIEFRAKMLEKLSKDEKNQLKIKESYSVLISNDEFFGLMK